MTRFICCHDTSRDQCVALIVREQAFVPSGQESLLFPSSSIASQWVKSSIKAPFIFWDPLSFISVFCCPIIDICSFFYSILQITPLLLLCLFINRLSVITKKLACIIFISILKILKCILFMKKIKNITFLVSFLITLHIAIVVVCIVVVTTIICGFCCRNCCPNSKLLRISIHYILPLTLAAQHHRRNVFISHDGLSSSPPSTLSINVDVAITTAIDIMNTITIPDYKLSSLPQCHCIVVIIIIF